MKFHVRHLTRYQYSSAVSDGQSSTVLLPRTTPWQQVERSELVITPSCRWMRERTDWFGNRRHDFAVESVHDYLEVLSESRVNVSAPMRSALDHSPAWESACVGDPLLMAYRLPSSLVPACDAQMWSYAATSLTPGRPILAAVMELTQRIYQDFAYTPGATDIATPVRQVFQNRQGVCQDFAHVALTLLRGHGLACRYVSGYLETQPPPGQPRLIGADASHAWIAVQVPGMGWVDFDPTNNQMPTDRHITIAWGRDYSDVVPVKGFTSGGGSQSLSVSVDVRAVEDAMGSGLV